MELVSSQKHLRVTPRKMREIIFVVKGLTPTRALEVLPFVRKRSADVLYKAIKTSIANAINKGISESDLSFKEIQVNEGTRLKRYRPGSRGRAMPYAKRLSHLRIVLEAKEKPAVKVQKAASPKIEKAKKVVKAQKIETEKKGVKK